MHEDGQTKKVIYQECSLDWLNRVFTLPRLIIGLLSPSMPYFYEQAKRKPNLQLSYPTLCLDEDQKKRDI